MEGDESGGVAEGEFVERINNREERHRKHKNFWVIECAEEFLDLSEGGENEKLRVVYERRHLGKERVERVAGEEDGQVDTF